VVFAGAVIGWWNRQTRLKYLLVVELWDLLTKEEMIKNTSTC
jgi:hypothetical protein